MDGCGARKRAAWSVAAAGAAVTAACLLSACAASGVGQASDSVAATSPDPTPPSLTPTVIPPAPALPSATLPSAPSLPPTPTLPPVPQGASATVLSVVDGDTIVTDAGKIRLIGIDTPEVGNCNYRVAGDELRGAIAAQGNQVVLVPGAHDDKDKYGRLLRYVQTPDGTDLNLHMVQSGLAIARYDSRDGYGYHPREASYIAADYAAPARSCPNGSSPSPSSPPTPAQQQPLLGTGGGADTALDPRFTSCSAAKAAGYGPYLVGVDPEYAWYHDGDGDGRVCEY